MKKKIAWILTLILLSTSLTACGDQESTQNTFNAGETKMSDDETAVQTSSEEMDEITWRLLNDWYGYIVRCEFLYGDMKWALSYMDPFLEDHSWGNLQIARTAMSQAKRRLEMVEPFEAQMSFEDYDRLMQSGADVGAVKLAVDNVQVLKNAVSVDYQAYRNYLNSPAEEIFLNHDLAHLESWTDLMQQIYDIYLVNCAIQTDYLLLVVDKEDVKAQFVEAIKANCPQINACREDNPQDADTLLEKSAELGNELEALVNKINSLVGQAQNNLERFRDLIELAKIQDTDDIENYISDFSADAVDLKDFPIALPYPDWWYNNTNETFQYIWNNGETSEDSESGTIWPGDTIETPPDQYIVKWKDVSLEEYQTYITLLETYKIPAKSTFEEDGIHSTIYKFNSACFMLNWEENTVSLFTLEGSVCFAPPWYIYYTRGSFS